TTSTPDGSKTSPFLTIADGFNAITSARTRIALADGTYPERIVVPANMPDVSIFGGYDASFTTRDLSNFHSMIVGDNDPGNDASGSIPGPDMPSPWSSHTLVWRRGPSNVIFDGIEFRPGARAGCSAGGCARFTLGVAD